MDGFPLFTPEEARATLPRLKPILAKLREAFHEYRFALAQRDELRAMHGETLDDPRSAERPEWLHWASRTEALKSQVQSLVRQVNELGADVKDPLLGLVDFYARRGAGTVLLCYRDDEDDIRYWHPVDTGFSGRRPIEEL